jgi:RNA polymerase sigma-70 factor (ECF subfamily)
MSDERCHIRDTHPSSFMDPKDQKNTAFIKAYDDFSDDIFRFTYLKTKNRDTALDITQETFTKVWEYVEGGKEVGHMRGFLYQIARNLIIDHYRKKTSSSLEWLSESGFDPISEDKEPADDFAISEAMEIIESLDPKYREPIILRYIQDLSVKEVADTLDEEENTISVRIHRGLEKIRSQINSIHEA